MSPEQNPRGLGFPEEAFFSPDDPIRRPRAMVPGGLHTWPGGPLEEEGGEEARSFDLLQVSHPTPTPKEIAGLLDRLAEEVRNLDGERFGWKAGAAPLEAALRGVLSAYLRQGRGG